MSEKEWKYKIEDLPFEDGEWKYYRKIPIDFLGILCDRLEEITEEEAKKLPEELVVSSFIKDGAAYVSYTGFQDFFPKTQQQ